LFSDKQQAFLDFVLAHYVQEGVEELEQEKLTAEIRNLFFGFQRYLYQGTTASN